MYSEPSTAPQDTNGFTWDDVLNVLERARGAEVRGYSFAYLAALGEQRVWVDVPRDGQTRWFDVPPSGFLDLVTLTLIWAR